MTQNLQITEENYKKLNKQTKITTASIFFLVVVVLHIVGVLYHEKIAFLSKPFLMIALVLIYLASVKKANFWYVSALFFSFWGDVLLLFKEQFFVFGLASFLLAHILYIKIVSSFIKKINLKRVLLICLPFVIFIIGLLHLTEANLGEMKIPVIVYGIVISSFGVIVSLNFLQQKTTANLWLFLGAIIFIISDSFIAIHEFYAPKEMYQITITIMITYIVAQYLICKAIIAKTSRQL